MNKRKVLGVNYYDIDRVRFKWTNGSGSVKITYKDNNYGDKKGNEFCVRNIENLYKLCIRCLGKDDIRTYENLIGLGLIKKAKLRKGSYITIFDNINEYKNITIKGLNVKECLKFVCDNQEKANIEITDVMYAGVKFNYDFKHNIENSNINIEQAEKNNNEKLLEEIKQLKEEIKVLQSKIETKEKQEPKPEIESEDEEELYM